MPSGGPCRRRIETDLITYLPEEGSNMSKAEHVEVLQAAGLLEAGALEAHRAAPVLTADSPPPSGGWITGSPLSRRSLLSAKR